MTSIQRLFAVLLLTTLSAAGAATLAGEPLTIAALPFRNATDQAALDPVAEGLGDLFVACAQKAPGAAFVERTALKKVLAEQRISYAGLSDERTRVRVGRLLGATHIVTGHMLIVNGALRLNAHLIEVESARVVRSSESTGSLADLLETVHPLAVDLMKGVGLTLPPLDPTEVDRSPEANLHFMRGLGYYHGNARNHAIAEFMKTLAIDPSHASARWWNATCYAEQQEWAHAAIEYERFLQDFPGDPRAADVRRRLEQCRQRD